MNYTILYSGRFKKSYKLCKRRGMNIANFETVIHLLSDTGALPPKYHPHILTGNYAGVWECHIEPDWLLLWKQNERELTLLLLDTGTHSDIF